MTPDELRELNRRCVAAIADMIPNGVAYVLFLADTGDGGGAMRSNAGAEAAKLVVTPWLERERGR